ncbi:MAG TPA: hypothetical protein VFL85_01265 [Candidatus Saccharimonadales bacterium]|nr:hypothetical protein [Candidatus Saccharimonadales bacterium]
MFEAIKRKIGRGHNGRDETCDKYMQYEDIVHYGVHDPWDGSAAP